MGNPASRPPFPSQSILPSTYTEIRQTADLRFGKIIIYQHKEHPNSKVFSLHQHYFSNDEFFTARRTLQNHMESLQNCENLLQLIGYQQVEMGQLCGTGNLLIIYVEYIKQTLEMEINDRIDKLLYFNEQDIIKVAKGVASGISQIQNIGTSHGDIRPFNIFVNWDGNIKLCDNVLLNPIKNNYFKRLAGDIEVLLSPELLDAFYRKEICPQYDVEKADIYALGMTLLYMATLQNPLQTVYDRFNPIVKYDLVDKQLKLLSQNYSLELVDLIRQMLIKNPEERIGIQQIQQFCSYSYNKPINNLPQPQQIKSQYQNEIDSKVQEAIRKTEQTIQNNEKFQLAYQEAIGLIG